MQWLNIALAVVSSGSVEEISIKRVRSVPRSIDANISRRHIDTCTYMAAAYVSGVWHREGIICVATKWRR